MESSPAAEPLALGSAGAADLARKVGAMTDGQNIQVNEEMETNIPGLYAAGDCIGGLLHISTAVGERENHVSQRYSALLRSSELPLNTERHGAH